MITATEHVWYVRAGWFFTFLFLLFLLGGIFWWLLRPEQPTLPANMTPYQANVLPTITIHANTTWRTQLHDTLEAVVPVRTYVTVEAQPPALPLEWPSLPAGHPAARLAQTETCALWLLYYIKRGDVRLIAPWIETLQRCFQPYQDVTGRTVFLVSTWYDADTLLPVTPTTHPFLPMYYSPPSLELSLWCTQAFCAYVKAENTNTIVDPSLQTRLQALISWLDGLYQGWHNVLWVPEVSLWRTTLPQQSLLIPETNSEQALIYKTCYQAHVFDSQGTRIILDRGQYIHVVEQMMLLLHIQNNPYSRVLQRTAAVSRILSWLQSKQLLLASTTVGSIQACNCVLGGLTAGTSLATLTEPTVPLVTWSPAVSKSLLADVAKEDDAYWYCGLLYAEQEAVRNNSTVTNAALPADVTQWKAPGIYFPYLSYETAQGTQKASLQNQFADGWITNCAMAPVKTLYYWFLFRSLLSTNEEATLYQTLSDQVIYSLLLKHTVWDAATATGCNNQIGTFVPCVQIVDPTLKRAGLRYSQFSDGYDAASTYQALIWLYVHHQEAQNQSPPQVSIYSQFMALFENSLAAELKVAATKKELLPGAFRSSFEANTTSSLDDPTIPVIKPNAADGPYTQYWPSLRAHLWALHAVETALTGVAQPWSS